MFVLAIRFFLFGTEHPDVTVYPKRLLQLRIRRSTFVLPNLRVHKKRCNRVPTSPAQLSIHDEVSMVLLNLVKVGSFQINVRAQRCKVIKRYTRFYQLTPFVNGTRRLVTNGKSGNPVAKVRIRLRLTICRLGVLRIDNFHGLVTSFRVSIMRRSVLVLPCRFRGTHALCNFLDLLLMVKLFHPYPKNRKANNNRLCTISVPFHLVRGIRGAVLVSGISVSTQFPILQRGR